ncbi:MAG: PAS domain S-box protein, partial [Janthinobacterium lividum]
LTRAQRIAHVGSWELDLETDEVRWSDEIFRICGLLPQSLVPTIAFVLATVHPEDRDAIKQAFSACMHDGQEFNLGFRIVRPDGSARFVHGKGNAIRNGRHAVTKLVGTFLDVTEHERAQQALIKSEERFRSLVDLSSDWYWEQDPGMRFKTIFHHGSGIPGIDADRFLGRTLWEISGARWDPAAQRTVTSDMKAMRAFHDFEYSMSDAVNARQYIQLSGEPVFDASGAFTGYRGVGKDVTQRVRSDEDLRRFRAAMDASADGIFLLDVATMALVDVNTTACQMLHYSREEMLRLNPASLGVAPNPQLSLLYDGEDSAKVADRVEVRLRGRDGIEVPVEMQRRAQPSGDGWIIVAVARDITERMRNEEALQQSQDALRQLAAHQENIKEEERKRIAREIHDELGGLLTGIKAYVSVSIDRASALGSAPDQLLIDASDLADTAIETVRRVIADLRPSVLDQLGVWAALEWYAEQIEERTGLTCDCQIDDSAASTQIDPARSTMLFRIVQEALTNVVRHAGATRVTIRSRRCDDTIELEIADNGRGLDAQGLLDGESWGILGMHERTRHFGGELKINGTSGSGTAIVLRMPLENVDAT